MHPWLALLLPVLASPAQAADVPGLTPPRFVVVPLSEAADVEAAYAQLSALGARVVEREDRRGLDLAAGQSVRNSRVDEVRASLLEARARMRELDVDLAGAALNRARDLARQLADPASHLELIGEVLLERAGLLLARQAEGAARGELRLLATLDPSREALHPGLYPPSLVEAYALERAREAEGALLTVLPRPAGAEVLVDGRQVDAGTPLTLSAGLHWVSVRAAGRVTNTREVKLAPAASLLLEPLAAPKDAQEERARALTLLLAGDDAALLALKQLTGATALLGLDGASTFVEREGKRVVLARLPGQSLASAALVALTKAPEVRPPEPPEMDWTPWWIAGGATAAAAVGTAIGVSIWYLARPNVDLKLPRPVNVTCCSF